MSDISPGDSGLPDRSNFANSFVAWIERSSQGSGALSQLLKAADKCKHISETMNPNLGSKVEDGGLFKFVLLAEVADLLIFCRKESSEKSNL